MSAQLDATALQLLALQTGKNLGRLTATGLPPSFAILAWVDGAPTLGVNYASNVERAEAFAAMRYLLENEGEGR